MINLLPPTEKKRIKREFTLRVVSVFSLALLVSVAIGASLLSPSYIISRSRESEIERQLSILRQSESVAEEEEIKSAFRTTMQKLSILNTQSSTPLYEVLTAIIGHKPSGASISGLVLQRGIAGGGSSVTISGVAASRDDLLSFRRALEDDALFSEVVLPVSNLARDSDITFTLTLNGSF